MKYDFRLSVHPIVNITQISMMILQIHSHDAEIIHPFVKLSGSTQQQPASHNDALISIAHFQVEYIQFSFHACMCVYCWNNPTQYHLNDGIQYDANV